MTTDQKTLLQNHEKTQYKSKKNNDNFVDMFKKIKTSKKMLFFSGVIHLVTLAILLMLLIISLIGNYFGIEWNHNKKILYFSYIAFTIVVNTIIFMVAPKIVKKRSQFRLLAILVLILSTFILSGAFMFVNIMTLLFYIFTTIIIWSLQVVIAYMLLLIAEQSPN